VQPLDREHLPLRDAQRPAIVQRPVAPFAQSAEVESLVLSPSPLHHVMNVQASLRPAEKAEIKLIGELL
jgi:hypothetical protein